MICPGFKAAGVAANIKKDGTKDLGLILSETDASAAAVFTRNLIKAAPVILDEERIKKGRCRAIIVNSGNANCCTGINGMKNALAMAKVTASELGISEELVLVASTGVIGEQFPIEKITAAVPEIKDSLSSNSFTDFAQSIMTTDTYPKIVSQKGKIDGKVYTVTGIAKGSGMICPDMATMLAFICTDAEIAPDMLKDILVTSTERSFNRITIDGDTSTNDTVIIMANGCSGAVIKNDSQKEIFQNMLDNTMLSLAKMIVKDGEGATKLVEIIVKGASSNKDARIVADTVANSSLVKTALFGEDANWGRIIAAAGRSKAPVKPDQIDIFFDNIMMVKNSTGCGSKAESDATDILKKPEFSITLNLNMGTGYASVFTCDFSIDYVKINADYRT
ncbi:MAG: bifunctional glutamate N-acetyltransferase/amino-acid acetyltransferase ArgJ [Deltaproteobacteria bacterium]|nr:bifunctional glutamate N-acetyltransferase/amino-acid acetyltransferase ArgJ [Deltaproteobacteria bacterium]